MDEQPPRRPRKAATFRPHFTLMMLYLLGFYLLYGLLFALPDLMELIVQAGSVPGPEIQERATQVTQRALGGGRLYLVLLASAVTVGLALWRRALPGLR